MTEPSADTFSDFIRAAAFGGMDVIESFIRDYPDCLDMREPGNGYPALSFALIMGQEDIARRLMEAGAGLETADNLGWTPLHHAVHHNREKFIDALVASQADAAAVTHAKKTTLMLAVTSGNARNVKKMLKAGVARHARDDRDRTAADIATPCWTKAADLIEAWPEMLDRRESLRDAAARAAKERAAKASAESVLGKIQTPPKGRNPFGKKGPKP